MNITASGVSRYYVNNYNRTSHVVQKTMDKIASGSNYPNASVGASEYAHVARLISDIGATSQSAQNAQNISSVVKIAEGATKSSIEGLQKINQYIVNAANDTNNSSDLQVLQKNINQQIAQIDANAYAKFNDMNLLDGSRNDLLLAGINGYSRLQLGDIRAQTLGLTDAQGNVKIDVTTSEGIQNAFNVVGNAIEQVENVNGEIQNSLKQGLAFEADLDAVTSQGAQLQGLEAKLKNYDTMTENQLSALSYINEVDILQQASDLRTEKTLVQLSLYAMKMLSKTYTANTLSLLP